MKNLTDALRVLNRRPGLAIVIVAILAVGIGVTTSAFSLFHQILIRPLPVAEPERPRLRAMVLKQVGVMAAIGCAVGIVAAIALVGAAEAILFGVSGDDPLAFGAAVAVLCLVALAAGYFPARRASRIAPMAALRYE